MLTLSTHVEENLELSDEISSVEFSFVLDEKSFFLNRFMSYSFHMVNDITILNFIKDHSILEMYAGETNSFTFRQPEVQVKS